jgi:hypothetical protein
MDTLLQRALQCKYLCHILVSLSVTVSSTIIRINFATDDNKEHDLDIRVVDYEGIWK